MQGVGQDPQGTGLREGAPVLAQHQAGTEAAPQAGGVIFLGSMNWLRGARVG